MDFLLLILVFLRPVSLLSIGRGGSMVTMSRWIYAVLCIVVPVLLVIACIFIIEDFHRPPDEAKRDLPLPLGQNLPLPNQLNPG